jgi:hypothetical protein
VGRAGHDGQAPAVRAHLRGDRDAHAEAGRVDEGDVAEVSMTGTGPVEEAA